MLTALLVGVLCAGLVMVGYLLGYAASPTKLGVRSRKAMLLWREGDPGFWHTSAVIETFLFGKPSQQTEANRNEERIRAAECLFQGTLRLGQALAHWYLLPVRGRVSVVCGRFELTAAGWQLMEDFRPKTGAFNTIEEALSALKVRVKP